MVGPWLFGLSHYIFSDIEDDVLGEAMPRRRRKEESEDEANLIRFNLLDSGDFIAAKAVVEDIDPLLKRNIFAFIHKKVHAVDSFAKYVVRQLVRNGIFCSYNSDITPLPDGFRLVMEFRLAAINKETVKRKMKTMYMTAFDLWTHARQWKDFLRRAEEEHRIAVEQAVIEGSLDGGGDLHQGSVPAGEGSRKEDEEG